MRKTCWHPLRMLFVSATLPVSWFQSYENCFDFINFRLPGFTYEIWFWFYYKTTSSVAILFELFCIPLEEFKNPRYFKSFPLCDHQRIPLHYVLNTKMAASHVLGAPLRRRRSLSCDLFNVRLEMISKNQHSTYKQHLHEVNSTSGLRPGDININYGTWRI